MLVKSDLGSEEKLSVSQGSHSYIVIVESVDPAPSDTIVHRVRSRSELRRRNPRGMESRTVSQKKLLRFVGEDCNFAVFFKLVIVNCPYLVMRWCRNLRR